MEGSELAVFSFSHQGSLALVFGRGKEFHQCAVGDTQVRLPVNCPCPLGFKVEATWLEGRWPGSQVPLLRLAVWLLGKQVAKPTGLR